MCVYVLENQVCACVFLEKNVSIAYPNVLHGDRFKLF